MNSRKLAPVAFLALFLVLSVCLPPSRSLAANDMVSEATYLSSAEKALAEEINAARTNPKQYATYLEQTRPYYSGKDYRQPGKSTLKTIEGLAAVDEALRFLRAASPMTPYTVSKGMSFSARDHVKDLGLTGNTGHKGTDGSIPDVRLNRYGTWNNGIGEDIAYNQGTARELVMGWIVDDGNASRGHRKNIFSASHQVIGMAVGDQTKYGMMTVIVFAGSYTEKSAGNSPAGKTKAVTRKL